MYTRNNTIGFYFVVVILALASVFSLRLFLQQRTAQDKLDIAVFPYTIEQWQGRNLPVTEKEYEILETRNLVVRQYTRPQGENLSLFVIYSETNRAVFHPPEVCLLGSGVKIADKSRERISSGEYKFFVSKLYAEKEEHQELILYCYKAGNFYTDNFYLQQAYFAFSQLLGRHRGGATIRVSMPIKGNEEATLATLKSFLVQTIKIIDSLS